MQELILKEDDDLKHRCSKIVVGIPVTSAESDSQILSTNPCFV